ncbi:MAG: hypothetical protein ACRDVC_00370 [Acidimicrobiales bacterium]
MSDSSIREFSVANLYQALDVQRLARELSWRQVADEIWDMSRELNSRRRDHPISPATLSGMRSRGATSCQHAMFMLHWLGRTPESFLVGDLSPLDAPLPRVGSDRRLRWSLPQLYEAMNAQRIERGLTWSALAKILRCSPSQLTGLRTAKYATNIILAMRITQWVARPSADFAYAAKW